MLEKADMIAVTQKILAREGGFVNDPVDKGGPTKFGITQATLSSWLSNLHGEPVYATTEDVKNLTVEGAAEIYVVDYILKQHYDYIPNLKLFEVVVDSAVNHGPRRATKWLQAILGVSPDGVIGGETKNKLMSANLEDVFKKYCAQRIKFYIEIVIQAPTQIKFLRGWINRATSFLEA